MASGLPVIASQLPAVASWFDSNPLHIDVAGKVAFLLSFAFGVQQNFLLPGIGFAHFSEANMIGSNKSQGITAARIRNITFHSRRCSFAIVNAAFCGQ
jgi:hypothetical protein